MAGREATEIFVSIDETNEKINAALTGALMMAQRKYRVFALDAKDRPRGKWKEGATTDPATIKAWEPFTYYAVVLGPGQFVLDLDMKGGKDGVSALLTVEAEHGPLPETFMVQSPSGGLHLYYAGGPVSNTVERIAPGVDTRAEGGYVVGPGSDGYLIHTDAPIAEAPAWLIEMAKPQVREEREAAGALDTADNIARALAFLAKRGPAIQGQGGDAWTYETVATVKDLGISQGKAREVLAEWDRHNQPPWGDEIEIKIANAYLYGQNAPGADAVGNPQETFAEVIKTLPVAVSPSITPAGPMIEPVSFDKIASRAVAPVAELIPGLLEKGIATMLAGKGGTHKSRVALQWGLHLQAGADIYGRPVERATFIYLDYENGADEVARRTHLIRNQVEVPGLSSALYYDFKTPEMAGNGAVPEYHAAPVLAVVSDEGIDVTPFYYKLFARLRSIPGHKFVVFDSTYNVLRFVGQAKINETAVKTALNLLDHLAAATDSTVLYLWHPSQAGLERGDASGWSVAWNNTPRARLSLSQAPDKEGPGMFYLKVEKRNHGKAGDTLPLQWRDGVLSPRSYGITPEEKQDQGKLVDIVVELAVRASERGQPWKRKVELLRSERLQIEDATGVIPNRDHINEAIALAVEDKRLIYFASHSHFTGGYYRGDLDLENVKRYGLDEATRMAEQLSQRKMMGE
jgi:hypothetical protein